MVVDASNKNDLLVTGATYKTTRQELPTSRGAPLALDSVHCVPLYIGVLSRAFELLLCGWPLHGCLMEPHGGLSGDCGGGARVISLVSC